MNDTAYSQPSVAVVIPMLNEQLWIELCVRSVLAQDYPKQVLEILVVDGGSTDRSLDIVRRLAKSYPSVRLLGGADLNCPAALNCGIRTTKADIVCKVDAHGYIAPDFVRTAVERLNGDGRLMCVGGPIRPVAHSLKAQSNSAARASRFGVGLGVNTLKLEDQLVDTVQCGAYRREIFDEVGGFDETLQFGEDEEMNWRIIQAGHRILFTPAMQFHYFPRESFRSFFLQYYRYGRARVQVMRKHPRFLNVKHIVPGALVIFLIATFAAIPLSPLAMRILFTTLFLYALCSFTASIAIARQKGSALLLTLPVSFACLHFGYGLGSLSGIHRWLFSRISRHR